MPRTLTDLYARAQRYMYAEEQKSVNRRQSPTPKGDREKPPFRKKEGRRRDRITQNQNGRYAPQDPPPVQVYEARPGGKNLQRDKANEKSPRVGKYCEFHRRTGHNTSECREFQAEIDALLEKGSQRRAWETQKKSREDIGVRADPPHPEVTGGVILTIQGGPPMRHRTRAVPQSSGGGSEVLLLGKRVREDPEPPISFGEEDLKGVRLPHDDPLVGKAIIGNFEVRRILIDTGSSANILFVTAFDKLRLDPRTLTPTSSLVGFNGHAVVPRGVTSLPVTLGTKPAWRTVLVDFVVVKGPSHYNAIFGRPLLNTLEAVVSTFHLKMKFPTPYGIGIFKGDQPPAPEYSSLISCADPEEIEAGPSQTKEGAYAS